MSVIWWKKSQINYTRGTDQHYTRGTDQQTFTQKFKPPPPKVDITRKKTLRRVQDRDGPWKRMKDEGKMSSWTRWRRVSTNFLPTSWRSWETNYLWGLECHSEVVQHRLQLSIQSQFSNRVLYVSDICQGKNRVFHSIIDMKEVSILKSRNTLCFGVNNITVEFWSKWITCQVHVFQ